VALENIDILESDGLVERSRQSGERLLKRLRTLESLAGVGHVRGQGLIAAVEVVADKSTKALHAPQLGVSQRLTDALLARGLCTRVVMDCICLAPPLMIEDDLLDRAVDIIGDAIPAVLADVAG
jgi:adenosylmethionine-8-amino-7-oxononanoate aminotransferase